MKNHPWTHNLSLMGLGTTNLWNGPDSRKEEVFLTAIREYGIRVIDTAEMYGRAEEGAAGILEKAGRGNIFLIDKILPGNVTEEGFERSLERSLKRLGTDYIDLYLLHWREDADLELLVRKMEAAKQSGKIREWGVSNFDTKDLRDLMKYTDHVFANQVFYSVYERGIEVELLPFMRDHGIHPISYSALGSGYISHPNIRDNERVMRLCAKWQVEPEAVLLRRITEEDVLALFSTSSIHHLRQNLSEVPKEGVRELFEALDEEFPAPDHKYPLVKI